MKEIGLASLPTSLKRDKSGIEYSGKAKLARRWYYVSLSTLGLLVSFFCFFDIPFNAYSSYIQPILSGVLFYVPEFLRPVVSTMAAAIFEPWFLAAICVVLLAEKIYPADTSQRSLGPEVLHNALFWHTLDTGFRILVLTLYVPWLYGVFNAWIPPVAIEMGATAKLIVSLLVMDFLLWLSHLIRHRVPFFWAFHAVHHEPAHLNPFVNSRVHLGDVLIAFPISLFPLYLFGLNVQLAFIIVFVRHIHGYTIHANIKSNWGPLKYLLVTPQAHRIHHSKDPCHTDRNFGSFLSIWDYIFFTQWRNYDEYPIETGTQELELNRLETFSLKRSAVKYIDELIYPIRFLTRRRKRRFSGK